MLCHGYKETIKVIQLFHTRTIFRSNFQNLLKTAYRLRLIHLQYPSIRNWDILKSLTLQVIIVMNVDTMVACRAQRVKDL